MSLLARSSTLRSSTRSAAVKLTRGAGYGFGPMRPQSPWHKWREQEMLKAMPHNAHAPAVRVVVLVVVF